MASPPSIIVRSTSEVLQDHLCRRAAGDIEGDLVHNYSPDVVFLCEHGASRGWPAVRESAVRLEKQLAGGRFEVIAQTIDDEYALLLWTAASKKNIAECGVDSFIIRQSRIVMQSVHYRLIAKA